MQDKQQQPNAGDERAAHDAPIEAISADHLADVLRRAVEAAEDQAGCLLLIAHNPGVHQLAVEYLIESAASPSVLDKMSGGFPTGAAAIFSVDVAGRPSYEGWLTPETLA